MEEFTFFFSAQNPFSNWYPAQFTVNGVTFCNNEQFMMYCKAKLFGDEEIAKKILETTNPREHKAMGRKVKGFSEAVWDAKCELYVQKGCHAKFSQNPHLLQLLLDTEGTELVEASPYDRIWGVGLAASDPRILDKKNWLGQNRLGSVLMRVRDDLLKHEPATKPVMAMALKLTEGTHTEKVGEALLTYSVMTERGEVELQNISVPSKFKGKGEATRAIRLMIDECSAASLNITLFPSPTSSGGLSRKKLQAFYLKLGFEDVPNSNRLRFVTNKPAASPKM